MTAQVRSLLTLAVIGLAASCTNAGADQAAPAGTLTDSDLAAQTFEERFERFDAGADLAPGRNTHRWRTVMGYGGPSAFSNFRISNSSIGIDRDFPGVVQGKLGREPLGLDPFEVSPGQSLTIVGRPVPPALSAKVWGAKYYSGQITTKFSFAQRYGYFEVEAILPAGKGFWPSFWLLPVKGRWPVGGEIDVFEGLGDPRVIYTSLHWGADHQRQQRKVTLPFDASAGFHRYGVAWTPEHIAWYVDRREVFRAPTPPEVQDEMFLILGLGVGGPWGGYPDASTQFPGRYTVRSVRAWKLSGTYLRDHGQTP